MQKPNELTESHQRRLRLSIAHGHSVHSKPAVMPWYTDAKESIVSMSRRLTTLILKSSSHGGFRNGTKQPV